MFVRFLEEIEDTKRTFRNYLTFKEFQARSFCLSYSEESPERIGTEEICPLLFLADTTLL